MVEDINLYKRNERVRNEHNSKYTQERELKSPTKFIYKTDFKLDYPVNDLKSAQEFLTDEPMLMYFNKGELFEKLNSITWILKDVQNGFIEVRSRVELNEDELEEISKFILEQNSYGLGEGFEQQEFAETKNPLFDEDIDAQEDDEYFYSCFDWRTNLYLLRLCRVI